MAKVKKTSIKLSHRLYDSQGIKEAGAAFSEVATILVVKGKDYSEVTIENAQDQDMILEFANYALSLTIQAR